MNSVRVLSVAIAVLTIAAGAAIVPAIAERGQGQPIVSRDDPRRDIGQGETLIVLVAGEFATSAEAKAAQETMSFSDVEGFQIARSEHFTGLTPGRFVLVTAFRTPAGADAFEPLARAAGAKVRRIVTRYTGTTWIGLGQEEDPTGAGPLSRPLS